MKDRRSTSDQTWMLASDEPERMKFELGSTTTVVTGRKCDAVVATWRPVQTFVEHRQS